MDRSLVAVIGGTFTLRFSTGLTGGLLLYYLASLGDLPGGRPVGAFEVGLLTALYFVAELVLSPAFGILSDRVGTHPIMQLGPIFGAVAVVMTALTTDLLLLGVTRWVEGAAAAASVPSILGYIAVATSRDEGLRGKTVARFEAATLAGLGGGVVAAGGLFALIGRNAFFVNAAIYLLSLLIYRYGVGKTVGHAEEPDQPAADGVGERARERFNVGRYARILRNPGVWLLAPTWIAVNAFVGVWTSQSIFQLVQKPRPGFEAQLLMGGFAPFQVSIGLAVWLLVFFAGLLYWGNRFKRFRRTTIIAIGIVGGLVQQGALYALNHSADWGIAAQLGLGLVAAAGLFVLAGATPAALGLLADISESHPSDRGAIMGLYSVFLALGQISGSLIGGGAAQWAGIDGLLVAGVGMLLVALLPVRALRGSEHLVGARAEPMPPPGGRSAESA
ncbi:MAG: MFS transporter [Chloroflexota bacterium]|nr:MFS transporter [Chloroflexota bacterium]